MSQTLTLPDDLYRKLCDGAAERGLTIESLLTFVSEIVAVPRRPTEHDRERSRRIERLLRRYRSGSLNAGDCAELDRLIDADYQEACARADRAIRAKRQRGGSGSSP